MKKIIGLAVLVTGSLLFAGNAQAGLFDRCCRCSCAPQPACPPAATASTPGTTSYTATYQAAETPATARRVGMPSPSLDRAEYMRQYQQYRSGR